MDLVAYLPDPRPLPPLEVIFDEVDPLVLEHIYTAPGRNDPCRCGSGVKYKKCCLDGDNVAWSDVARVSQQAVAALTLLRTLPRSGWEPFDPEPE